MMTTGQTVLPRELASLAGTQRSCRKLENSSSIAVLVELNIDRFGMSDVPALGSKVITVGRPDE